MTLPYPGKQRATMKPKEPYTELAECSDCGCWHERGKCPATALALEWFERKRDG